MVRRGVPAKSVILWGERRHKSPNDASVIHCYLVAERESEYAKEPHSISAALFVHTFYPLFNVHSADFFSNNLFSNVRLCVVGDEEVP